MTEQCGHNNNFPTMQYLGKHWQLMCAKFPAGLLDASNCSLRASIQIQTAPDIRRPSLQYYQLSNKRDFVKCQLSRVSI